MNNATSLAQLTVLDTEGEVLTFGTFWAERPAVLVFLRHFG